MKAYTRADRFKRHKMTCEKQVLDSQLAKIHQAKKRL
jgi:hypothetical protein